MLDETRINWGPGAVFHDLDCSITLDFDCILVPESIGTLWPDLPQRPRLADEYLRRQRISGSQPFAQHSLHWNWKI